MNVGNVLFTQHRIPRRHGTPTVQHCFPKAIFVFENRVLRQLRPHPTHGSCAMASLAIMFKQTLRLSLPRRSLAPLVLIHESVVLPFPIHYRAAPADRALRHDTSRKGIGRGGRPYSDETSAPSGSSSRWWLPSAHETIVVERYVRAVAPRVAGNNQTSAHGANAAFTTARSSSCAPVTTAKARNRSPARR